MRALHASHIGCVWAQVYLNTLAYNVMWRFAEKQLLCGLSVIVDCPLAREELFVRGTAIAPVTPHTIHDSASRICCVS